MFIYVLQVRDLTTGNLNDLAIVVSTLCLEINDSKFYLCLLKLFVFTTFVSEVICQALKNMIFPSDFFGSPFINVFQM